MKKPVQALLTTTLAAFLLSGVAFAEQIGVVDMQELSQQYTKAQDLQNQVKEKEDELNKLRDELANQLKAGDKLSPVARKSLEDKLNDQFAARFKEYRDWTATQELAIKTDLDKAIQQVSSAQKLDIVLPKQAVLEGGKDITSDVLKILSK